MIYGRARFAARSIDLSRFRDSLNFPFARVCLRIESPLGAPFSPAAADLRKRSRREIYGHPSHQFSDDATSRRLGAGCACFTEENAPSSCRTQGHAPAYNTLRRYARFFFYRGTEERYPRRENSQRVTELATRAGKRISNNGGLPKREGAGERGTGRGARQRGVREDV